MYVPAATFALAPCTCVQDRHNRDNREQERTRSHCENSTIYIINVYYSYNRSCRRVCGRPTNISYLVSGTSFTSTTYLFILPSGSSSPVGKEVLPFFVPPHGYIPIVCLLRVLLLLLLIVWCCRISHVFCYFLREATQHHMANTSTSYQVVNSWRLLSSCPTTSPPTTSCSTAVLYISIIWYLHQYQHIYITGIW